jgi:hypothetical protein
MSIRIDEFTRGRFGNRILQYNNMMQLAHKYGLQTSCVSWEGNQIFEDLVVETPSDKKRIYVGLNEILSSEDLQESSEHDYVIDVKGLNCPIHNSFYHLTKKDPRNFFKINNKYKKALSPDVVHVGIHFRGTDKHRVSEGREIHSSLYYRKAIKAVLEDYDKTKSIKFYIGTDDRMFNNYVDTISYLKSEGLDYDIGSDNQFEDFSVLSECDYLIGSSSTFVVCTGFMGKKNKKIIHSDEWLQKSVKHEPWHPRRGPDNDDVRKWQFTFDNFWVDLYNGGNEFYKMWKVI